MTCHFKRHAFNNGLAYAEIISPTPTPSQRRPSGYLVRPVASDPAGPARLAVGWKLPQVEVVAGSALTLTIANLLG